MMMKKILKNQKKNYQKIRKKNIKNQEIKLKKLKEELVKQNQNVNNNEKTFYVYYDYCTLFLLLL
jgi:hypothetical protein